jgi:hypothetical protein
MAVPRFISDLAGTAFAKFQVGLGASAAVLKSVSGAFVVRNKADSADAPLTASLLSASGDSVELNSDAAGSGADWKLTLKRPATGMTAELVLTLPADGGSPGQMLVTDGDGGMAWTDPSGGYTNSENVDVTDLAFGDSSPVAMFTKPADSFVSMIRVVIDTPFDGDAPSLSIGVAGTTSKYVATTQVDLTATAGTVFEIYPGVATEGSAEALIATYAADSSTAGAARIYTHYAVPN